MDEVSYVLRALVGEVGEKVLMLLLEHEEGLDDEEIAEKLGLRINDVRRALYELAKMGFVEQQRIARGELARHSYRWRTDKGMIARALLQRKRATLKKLEERLAVEESSVLYLCPIDGYRYTFDEAFENYFTCPRCGSDLIEINNEEIKKVLRQLVEKLREEIARDEAALSRSV